MDMLSSHLPLERLEKVGADLFLWRRCEENQRIYIFQIGEIKMEEINRSHFGSLHFVIFNEVEHRGVVDCSYQPAWLAVTRQKRTSPQLPQEPSESSQLISAPKLASGATKQERL